MPMNRPSFFPSLRSLSLAGLAVAALLLAAPSLRAQDTIATPAQADTTLSNAKPKKTPKADRIQQTKDTKRENKKESKLNPLLGKDANLPDKQLFDKAIAQEKSGHYDIARLDLQTMLNTYPDSPYQTQAKLAIADCWYREGGTAALTQAEQEYKDFITFFPNAPEAALAQMRVGDIYFKEMDVPDRDYTKAIHAEEEYRTMLKQYPDAPKNIIIEAKQKLREVQETLALRETLTAAFYATHNNWPATIARYQTVVDTYPLYSHMDDALIGLGDAYEAESAIVRAQNMPEAAKVRLLEEFDGKAADAYRAVVTLHAAAPHVEDAKERLVGMHLPVPEPTKEQLAASEELEGSRAQYTMSKRLALVFMHRPDVVTAAQIGDPLLDDPEATVAPTIVRNLVADYRSAFDPNTPKAVSPLAPKPAEPTTNTDAPPPPPASDAPLTLSDVPGPGQGASSGTTSTMEATPAGSAPAGNSLGVDIITPGATGTAASNLPSATGAQDPNNGLSAVGPKNSSALPAIEKPEEAPDQVNDVAGKKQPAAQTNGKAPAVDKTDESSSKKKPKTGLDKLNPF